MKTKRQPGILLHIPQEVHKQLEEIFPTKTYGAEQALYGFLEIRKSLVDEVFGRFTSTELLYLIDTFDENMNTPRMMINKKLFLSVVELTDKELNLSGNYGISISELLEKIDTMLPVEIYFMIDELRLFKMKQELGKITSDGFIKSKLEIN
jgi:hypothetical protein